jgi:hypothetical protein
MQMNLRVFVLTVVLATFGSSPLEGQTAEPDNPSFAKEAAVIERLTRSIVFEADGSHTENSELRVRIQSAGALQQLGTIAVPYSREFDTVDFLYVRARKPDGSVV